MQQHPDAAKHGFADLQAVFEGRYRPHRMRDFVRSPQSASEKTFQLMTHAQGRALPKLCKERRSYVSQALKTLTQLALAARRTATATADAA